MLYQPTLHGFAGAWDEIIFVIAFLLSILIFIALAFKDKKRNAKNGSDHEK